MVELAGFPNPDSATGCASAVTDPFAAMLIDAIEPQAYREYLGLLAAGALEDFPNSAQILFHFDGALDEARLPSPMTSLDPGNSPILLVDVDPATSTRGRVVPVESRVFHASRYLAENSLSILPVPGFSLEPGRLYAVVVRRNLGDATGQPLGSPWQVEQWKQTEACGADPEHRAAFDYLDSQFGIGRDQVAAMALFRAGRPTDMLDTVLAAVDQIPDPEQLAGLVVDSVTLDQNEGYYLVSGSFETLIQQYGEPPYLPAIQISFFAGQPQIDVTLDPGSQEGSFLSESPATSPGGTDRTLPRTERIDFLLSVPVSLVPTSGDIAELPVVIFGAGTGGSIYSPFESGVASVLGASGLCTFSTTPVMHAERAHSENIDPQLLAWLRLYDLLTGQDTAAQFIALVESGQLFFNPLNLQAARGNSLQAAVDYAWQARLLSETSLVVPFGSDPQTVSFDSQRVHFLGHSQGAATGPLLANSQALDALVLSAPAGHLPTNLLGKTKPSDQVDISAMLGRLVCDDPSEPLDVHHPVLNLLMHWFEPADAVNYAPRLIGEAPIRGKHSLVLVGTEDHYVAPGSHDAVTNAARFHQVSPELRSVLGQSLLHAILPLAGYGTTYGSLSGNLDGHGFATTGAFRQYHEPSCSDDHFVFLCSADAVNDWSGFLESALPDEPPSVP